MTLVNDGVATVATGDAIKAYYKNNPSSNYLEIYLVHNEGENDEYKIIMYKENNNDIVDL